MFVQPVSHYPLDFSTDVQHERMAGYAPINSQTNGWVRGILAKLTCRNSYA
jgi:hypothetical protein